MASVRGSGSILTANNLLIGVGGRLEAADNAVVQLDNDSRIDGGILSLDNAAVTAVMGLAGLLLRRRR